jgi:6,7-dimethyl-8-ribityllumazine synthase
VPQELKGELQGEGLRIAVIVARFNQFVTQRLLEGAQHALSSHGVRDEDIVVAWVPGAFELPVISKTFADTGRYDAIICLGAVIRGETAHFDVVARHACNGIGKVSLDTGVPVMLGVLTTDDMDQAINRAGGKSGNVGHSAAVGAIETARLIRAAKNLGS